MFDNEKNNFIFLKIVVKNTNTKNASNLKVKMDYIIIGIIP
jgi:hypothetical protein